MRELSYRELTSDGVQLVVGSGAVAAANLGGLVHELRKQVAEPVVVVLTPAALRFVTVDAVRHLGDCTVLTDETPNPFAEPVHVWATEYARGLLVYPASGDFLGRIAGGLGTDLASTTVLNAYGVPTLVAPSVHARMWANPLVQANLAQLRAAGMGIAETTNGTAPPVARVVELMLRQRRSDRLEEVA